MIVVVLGAVMINRGLILTGSGYDLHSIISLVSRMIRTLSPPSFEAPSPPPASLRQGQARTAPALEAQHAPTTPAQPAPQPRPAFQTIEMDVIISGFSPNHFVLSRGIPVKWIINGKQVTSCNHRIIVPSFGLELTLQEGSSDYRIHADENGVIPWSCWMGMLHGDFEVIEPPPAAAAQPEIAINAPAPSEIAANPPAESAKRDRGAECCRHFRPAAATSYTIVSGDTLRGVAVKLFHDARRWREISAINPGLDARRLRPGQVIKLPQPPNEGSQGR